jgi:hypothetical protein
MDKIEKQELKLFMLLLGSKPPGRHVEQHDFFFGIAMSLKELVPDILAFWPEAGTKIHIDAWREVTMVDGWQVHITNKELSSRAERGPTLFFINLGGYQENKFEEQHYTLLTVQEDRATAFSEAKKTSFFKHNHFPGAHAHIDDKYGVDVDDLYEIEEILSPSQKEKYSISLTRHAHNVQDTIHLGYFKLSQLK